MSGSRPDAAPSPHARRWLLGALLVGFALRAPGLLWGADFPTGFHGHHIDETIHTHLAAWLVQPKAMADPDGHPGYVDWRPYYPPGVAAHVAVLHTGARLLRGELMAPPPPPAALLYSGRVVALLYGVATILVVFGLARRLLPGRPDAAPLAAWGFALCGMHVTQSHFFLPDTAMLFWTLLALYALARHLETPARERPAWLYGAAFAAGVAFGTKFAVIALPSVVIAALRPRVDALRVATVAAFAFAGLGGVTLNGFPPHDVYSSVMLGSLQGAEHAYELPRLASAALYALELPSVVGLPLVVLGAWGVVGLARRLPRRGARAEALVLVCLLPIGIALLFLLFAYDHFPRHLLTLLPWWVIAAAWALARGLAALRRRGLHPAFALVPLLAYLGAFVVDGERTFWNDPRTPAARWLLENVPEGARVSWLSGRRSPFAKLGYRPAEHPGEPAPEWIVSELLYANWALSGMGLRDSHPQENGQVFPWFTEDELHAIQALHGGESAYIECARFREAQWMPEYVWTDRLLGNRQRSYVGEIVIFRHPDAEGSCA